MDFPTPPPSIITATTLQALWVLKKQMQWKKLPILGFLVTRFSYSAVPLPLGFSENAA